MNSDIGRMVEALEADGWSIGEDGRITRQRGEGTQVNATVPLARVTLDGKARSVSVRDIVAHKHLGAMPLNSALVAADGNAANTAVANLAYEPRTGKRAATQAARAERAQAKADALAKKAEEAATRAKEAAAAAKAAAGGAPPKPRRTKAA